MITEFERYIPDGDLVQSHWIRDPFLAKVEDLAEDILGLQEELIELHHNKHHQQRHATTSLGEFWMAVKKDKVILSTAAMVVLIPFSMTYLCERSFSTLTMIKTKHCNSLPNLSCASTPS
jgi:hypothetical protein